MSLAALFAQIARARALRLPDPAGRRRLPWVDAVVVVGASGAGKSTLVDAVRGAALAGVTVPPRFVTRPRRAGDDLENVHLERDEFARRAAGGAMGLRWVRRMEGGREERYGFPPPAPGTLAVYSGNNALYANRASVRPEGALAHAFLLGVVAPDPIREERLRRRSPDLWRRAPAELAHRLADRADSVLAHVHAVVDNHGELEEAARAEVVWLVARLAALAGAGAVSVTAGS